MWVEVLCWIDRVWSSKECACCVCDPSMNLSVLSICFVCVFVCQKDISSFKSLGVGSQVFAFIMLFLWVILHTMWSRYEHAIAVHLALWYVVLVCHQYDVCENSVGSVYVGGYGGLSESGLCVIP